MPIIRCAIPCDNAYMQAVQEPLSISTPDAIEPREFRNALGRFATGVTVITTGRDGQIHGMTANAFQSVSLDPPLVLVSVNQHATMHKILSETGRYGVSVLSEEQAALSDHFARRHVEGVHVEFAEKHGVPLIKGAIAQLVARVVDMHPAGDHTLFIGHVEHLEWTEGKPLLFFGGKYHHMAAETAKPGERIHDFSYYLVKS